MRFEGRGGEVGGAEAGVLCGRACDDEYVKACRDLGWMYEHGRGVEQDLEQAVALYKRACDAGDKDACANLNRLYLQGDDVTIGDAARAAMRWACEVGLKLACDDE